MNPGKGRLPVTHDRDEYCSPPISDRNRPATQIIPVIRGKYKLHPLESKRELLGGGVKQLVEPHCYKAGGGFRPAGRKSEVRGSASASIDTISTTTILPVAHRPGWLSHPISLNVPEVVSLEKTSVLSSSAFIKRETGLLRRGSNFQSA